MAEIPATTEAKGGTMRITVEAEIARREEIKKVRGELLTEANKLQERANSLRTLAHRLHLLTIDATSGE